MLLIMLTERKASGGVESGPLVVVSIEGQSPHGNRQQGMDSQAEAEPIPQPAG
jgi:hypothetical protein